MNAANSDFSIISDIVAFLVTAEENAALIALPSEQEIRNTVFSMDPLSAPGLDGFTGRFYSHCWPVVGSDVVLAVQEFFRAGKVFHVVNSNFIVLVPKTSEVNKVEQYRPIALGNFFFK
ncbi:hypothetical protein TorRG33x02_042510, partial [Trema orientale]